MKPKKFIIKTVVKVLIFVTLMIIVSSAAYTSSIILTNEIALGQMQNSNEAFVVMNAYNEIKSIFGLIAGGIIILFTCVIARDTYKFFKNQKEN